MSNNPSILKLQKLNTNVQVQLEVLTPLHIGTADDKKWFKNIDFLYQGGFVNVIDSQKLYLQLMNLPANNNRTVLDLYTQYLADGRHDRIERLFQNNDIDLSQVAQYQFEYHDELPNEIRPLIRSGQGTPLIPGSSIKGAIRSVIFNYLYGKSNTRGYNKYTESDLIGNFDRSIMRYIRPYDAELKDTELVDIDLFNLYSRGINWQSKYKEGFTIVAESFKPESTTNLRLSIADGLANVIEEAEKRQREKYLPQYIRYVIPAKGNPVAFLFGMINQYTRQHLTKEIEFFKKYPQAEDTDVLIELLEEIKERTDPTKNKGKTCVLRLAYGSGFHGITGDWRFKDHTETIQYPDEENKTWNRQERRLTPTRYKSRRIADNGDFFAAMGFVELKI